MSFYLGTGSYTPSGCSLQQYIGSHKGGAKVGGQRGKPKWEVKGEAKGGTKGEAKGGTKGEAKWEVKGGVKGGDRLSHP